MATTIFLEKTATIGFSRRVPAPELARRAVLGKRHASWAVLVTTGSMAATATIISPAKMATTP